MTTDSEIDRLATTVDDQREELEVLRVMLSACGVAAMANTPETVAQRIKRDSPYWTSSYGDVCNAVDREMKLRHRQDETVRQFIGWLSGDIPELNGVEVPRLAESWERFQAKRAERGVQS